MPIAALAALLIAATPAFGRWHETGRDAEQVDAVDLASVEGSGSVRRAWSRVDYLEPHDGVATDFYQNEYDCSARTFTLIAWRRLGTDGRERDAGTVPTAERQTDTVDPGTIGDDEMALICGEEAEGPPPIIA